MDQTRIGKFLAACRHEKKLTQAQVAKSLGVSDRTVGNWENGRNMPDLSLIVPICELLDISVNDFISGERISAEKRFEKSEENIRQTIDFSSKTIRRKISRIRIAAGSALAVLILTALAFAIDINRMMEKKEVVFSTWGIDYTAPVDLTEKKIELAVTSYLAEEADSVRHASDEKSFAAAEIYLIENSSENLSQVYAWCVTKTYRRSGDVIAAESGSALPCCISVSCDENGGYAVEDLIIPRDGTYYADDIKDLFPRQCRQDILDASSDGTTDCLTLDLDRQAELWFS